MGELSNTSSLTPAWRRSVEKVVWLVMGETFSGQQQSKALRAAGATYIITASLLCLKWDWHGWVGVLCVHGVNSMGTWEWRRVFRYWKFYGQLRAGTVKRQSLSPSTCLASHSYAGGRMKWGHYLSTEVDVQSPAVKPDCGREGRESLTWAEWKTQREALFTTDWAKSSHLRQHMQLHLPQQSCTCLHPTNRALTGFFFSLSLSLSLVVLL